jgi:lysozyme
LKKTTKKRIENIVLSLVVLLTLGGLAYWFILRERALFVFYPDFGIQMPVKFTVHGIDVSHHNSVINWQQVRAMQVKDINLRFCFIKATEGVDDEDELFERNWQKAREVGMVRGAYHFFLPQKSGRAQAQNFMNSVDLESGDLPPVLDIEETYGVKTPDTKKRVKEWLYTIEAYYHLKPIIYTNVDYYKNFLGPEFDGYPLWVAHYLQNDKPRIERNWIFWQHNESGKVNGMPPGVDFNVFNGDSISFKLLLKQ